MTGKYVRICAKPHEEIPHRHHLRRARGAGQDPGESYPSEDACEHAIFVKRVHDLLSLYGYSL